MRAVPIAQRHDEEGEADAITEETHDPCQKSALERPGRVPPVEEAKRETDGAGDEAFELDDLQRIGERHFTREVVVEPPRSTGTDDGERADSPDKVGWPDHASTAAPATRQGMPRAIRRSKFSLKMNDAISAVATLRA